MENQGQESGTQQQKWEADSPALAGISGRARLMVGDEGLGGLVVDDGHVSLAPGGGPVDVTIVCASRDDLVKLLRGELHPVVAALRGQVRQTGGDRAFGVKVVLGLRAGSPFVHTPFDGKDA